MIRDNPREILSDSRNLKYFVQKYTAMHSRENNLRANFVGKEKSKILFLLLLIYLMINLIPSFRTLLVLWPGFKVISSVCSVSSTSPASHCAGQPSLSSILDKGEKKLYCPKGIDPPKCKYCLNRPEALTKDHEAAETIPLQQI